MKKNSFIEGTIIATFAIFFIKILGMLYVIPFYAMIGAKGAILYAYAYNIYSLFLEISTAGVPNAVSKLVNEYNTLNMQEAKIRAFNLGKKILGFIAIIAFIILIVTAPQISAFILKDLAVVNTIEDLTFVIRCISLAILVFPFLSVTRGFFQGHNVIYVSSVSQVIEQVVRIAIILGGCYIALNVLDLSIPHAVGIACFGAFIGGVCSLAYVKWKLHKNQEYFKIQKEYKKNDKVTNKEILKKIINYALPIIIISIAFSIYNNVDMILILRTIDKLGFTSLDVQFIATSISTWAAKISIIITSVGLGLSSSLVPAMVEAFTLKNYEDVNRKFNKAIAIIIFITVPMCVGISLLSSAIWTVFYGYNNLGSSILAVCIFAPLFSNLYTVSNYTLQSMNKFKMVYISAVTGVLINLILDVPMMYLFNFLNIPAYHGVTCASIIGFTTTLLIAMHILKKEYKFNYSEIFKVIKKCIVPLISMILVVVILKYFMPINYDNKALVIGYIGLISVVGAIIYFVVANKMGLISEVLGNDFIDKLKKKIMRNKNRS